MPWGLCAAEVTGLGSKGALSPRALPPEPCARGCSEGLRANSPAETPRGPECRRLGQGRATATPGSKAPVGWAPPVCRGVDSVSLLTGYRGPSQLPHAAWLPQQKYFLRQRNPEVEDPGVGRAGFFRGLPACPADGHPPAGSEHGPFGFTPCCLLVALSGPTTLRQGPHSHGFVLA